MRQVAARVLVATTPERLEAAQADGGRPPLWDSGWIGEPASARSEVSYGGPPLRSGQRVWWTAMVRDAHGVTSPWSAPSWWEQWLRPEDWSAQWIGAPTLRVPWLRRTFTLPAAPRRARLYATALGCYRMFCNGTRVGADSFTPGWTDYRVRVPAQTYDVTALLRAGDNALGGVLADGWYAGYIGFQSERAHYGQTPQLRAQLVVECEDGTVVAVGTDAEWRAWAGPIVEADLLMGETYDARRALDGWAEPGFDDKGWFAARRTEGTTGRLVAQYGPTVRVLEEVAARAVTEPVPGRYVVDFGQNLVGWARLRLAGGADDAVVLRYAEVVRPDGTIVTDNLRSARATDVYHPAGHGEEEVWEPWFTFHGFRYVEVTGVREPVTPGTLTAVVCGTALEPAGEFACSSDMVNQLQSNIVWSLKGNFLEVPTDCPQRDERLGWMGDAQVFAETACFNRDVAAFLTKWMRDVVDAQSAEGGFPDVAPRIVDVADGMPAWGDAGVLVPWHLWRWYGDERLIATHLDALAKWVDFVGEVNPDGRWLERRGYDVGDWLALEAETPKDVLATAFFANSARVVAELGAAVGRDDIEARMGKIAARARDAFVAHYVRDDGTVAGETQTAYVLALAFGLLPAPLRPAATARLVADIEARGGHLSTGFVGVAHLLPVLTAQGELDLAYRLLLNDTYPSWGYPIRHGATTMWERWDGWTEESGFQDPAMNSFNHYAFGSVGAWLYQVVGGIAPAAPGFAEVRLAPRPGPGLDWARARHRAPQGWIACAWERDGEAVEVDVTLPPNTVGTFVPPPLGATATAAVTSHDGLTADSDGTYRLGSGRYRFRIGT